MTITYDRERSVGKATMKWPYGARQMECSVHRSVPAEGRGWRPSWWPTTCRSVKLPSGSRLGRPPSPGSAGRSPTAILIGSPAGFSFDRSRFGFRFRATCSHGGSYPILKRALVDRLDLSSLWPLRFEPCSSASAYQRSA